MKLTKQTTSLLRYPILILSLLLGLIGSKYILGIDYSNVSKITASGIEFQREAVQNATGELQQEVAHMQIELSMLQNMLANVRDSQLDSNQSLVSTPTELMPIPIVYDTVHPWFSNVYRFAISDDKQRENLIKDEYIKKLYMSEIVSDKLIDLNRTNVDEMDPSTFINQEGYLWIGNYVKNGNGWKHLQVRSVEKPLIRDGDPTLIEILDQFVVKENVILHKLKPENNLAFFKNPDIAALLPKSTKIEIQDQTILITTSNQINSIWVKVKAIE